MRQRIVLAALVAVGWLAFPVGAVSALRVALMDFSSEDNSYRSIQAAANFTSLVQAGFTYLPEFEWVERAQIQLSKTEFALAEMMSGGGASLRRGRMLGANWLVKGHFSKDDQERRTLTFQVIDLDHADVIAADTVVLPAPEAEGEWTGAQQVESAARALRRLLLDAQARTAQAAAKPRVAFLFLADTAASPFGPTAGALEAELRAALKDEAATNQRIRLVEFPKAYQATGEAEMVGDGMIAALDESWKRTADLYLWGTYATTNSRTATRAEWKLNLTLNLWDGVSPPLAVEESLVLSIRREVSPEQASALLGRVVRRTVEAAHVQAVEADSAAVRRKVADSIVKAYVASSGRTPPGLGGKQPLAQAVRMLETACFFDPDNADARILWLTCRYGWWIDFGRNVRNQFWTKWRRSKAWANYVERFGFNPGAVALPFPYNMQGIPDTYVGVLGDVIGLFPQWHSMEEVALEDPWRKQGVHTWLKEAEGHGFPKDMPHDLAFQWRKELETELAQRRARASNYTATNPSAAKAPFRPTTAPASPPAATAAPNPRPSGSGSPPTVAPRGSQVVPTPAWLKNRTPVFGLFKLYPPGIPRAEPKRDFERIQFPSRYEVRVIQQMAYREGQLWILAMDKRSSTSSDPAPDLSEETLEERTRLWRLETNSVKPALLQAGAFSAGINSFLLHHDQLWLAGSSVAVWDLKQEALRQFGFADGLAMKNVESLTRAGGRVVAAGGECEIASIDPAATTRWEKLNAPAGRLSHGSGYPFLLAGNEQVLGYVAGETWLLDWKTLTWTNLAAVKRCRCFAVAGATFWIGADSGLHAYDSGTRAIRSWNGPAFIESQMISFGGGTFGASITPSQLDGLETQILGPLRKLETERRRVRLARLMRNETVDPLQLNSRIPGRILALADDGDFLWLGAENYYGSQLLLLHKPSYSLVGGLAMAARNRISSLAVSDQHVWVGTSYGDDPLLRFSKEAFTSVPKSQWQDLALTPDERATLLKTMSPRDQALYAFYAGDDEQVVQFLAGLDPQKASLEEMLLLVWSCDLLGVAAPDQARTWCNHISDRHPDSPWSKAAQQSLRTSQALLARFDVNQDQQLDSSERAKMLAGEEALGPQNETNKDLAARLLQIFRTCDRDNDRRLNRVEALQMWETLATTLRVGPETMRLRAQADVNKDSFLDLEEFMAVIKEVRRIRGERNKWQ